MPLPKITVGQATYRLIPSRFPPIQTFEMVASEDDLAAVMELEGWTNDRLVVERLQRLPRDQWVYGIANASIVMASFIHVGASGSRFNGPDLGAWYAAKTMKAAIAEVSHHLKREAAFTAQPYLRMQYRSYSASLGGQYVDIRGLKQSRPELYHPSDYASSQTFGEGQRAAGEDGIAYDSVRLIGGENIVVYKPKSIGMVTVGSHYEVTAPLAGKIVARQLS